MPIRPENRARYPANWKTEIRPAILARAGNKCEGCGLENHSHIMRPVSGSSFLLKRVKIVLTIAHLDHTPENCNHDNLRALCQKCHNTYDAPMRAANRKQRKQAEQDRCKLPPDIKHYLDDALKKLTVLTDGMKGHKEREARDYLRSWVQTRLGFIKDWAEGRDDESEK